MPQLCLNSRDVTEEVKKRAALIGDEITKGLKKLHDAGKDDIFIGVIAGWETQIGKDFETGKPLGYCALTNKGFSAMRPPADFERARSDIVREFVAFWAQSLVNAGIPKDKIYSRRRPRSPSRRSTIPAFQPTRSRVTWTSCGMSWPGRAIRRGPRAKGRRCLRNWRNRAGRAETWKAISATFSTMAHVS
jgi:hypothetical protein